MIKVEPAVYACYSYWSSSRRFSLGWMTGVGSDRGSGISTAFQLCGVTLRLY